MQSGKFLPVLMNSYSKPDFVKNFSNTSKIIGKFSILNHKSKIKTPGARHVVRERRGTAGGLANGLEKIYSNHLIKNE